MLVDKFKFLKIKKKRAKMKQGKKESQAAAADVQQDEMDEATDIGQDEEDDQPFNEIDQL